MEGQEKTVRGIKTFLKTLVTVVLFIIYMFPFYMIVLNAFKHKRDIIKMPLSWGGKRGFTTDNFVDAFQQMNFMNILKNSLIITCVSVFLIILFSSMAAYIFVRKAWKINQIIFMVMLFSMVIPFQVVMIPLISIYGGTFGILNHRATLIFMHLGFSVSMAGRISPERILLFNSSIRDIYFFPFSVIHTSCLYSFLYLITCMHNFTSCISQFYFFIKSSCFLSADMLYSDLSQSP